MTDRYGQGAIASIDVLFHEGGGGPLVDADPVTLDIKNPSGVVIVDGASPTSNPSTGRYIYDFDIPNDAPLGIWTAIWSGVINDVPVGGDPDGVDFFEVVEAGELSFTDEYVVTVTELEAYMRTSFDSQASLVASDVITLCQGTLESWLNRPITIRSFIDVRPLAPSYLRGEAGIRIDEPPGRYYLSNAPVVTVTTVQVDDTVQGADSYVVRPYGIDGLVLDGDVLSVGYTAGYDGRSREHSGLKFAVMRAAAREMKHYEEGDFGLEEVRSEGYSAKFVDPASVFTDRELIPLTRYKRRLVAR